MQLIVVNGSSCSGKSTTVKGALKQRGGLYHLSYDSQKWMFSDYTADKYKGDVNAIVLAVAETVFSKKYPVLSDNSLFKEQREKIISKAREHGYEVIEVNIEAEYSILETRFKERVENAKTQQSTRIANTSVERFKELYAIYNAEKNPNAIVYRSDIMTPEEIIAEVLSFVK